MTSADLAADYVRAGWSVVPVRGKKAFLTGWEDLRLSVDDLPRYFTNGENVGGLLGAASGNRVDVDLDCPEALLLASKLLPGTGMVFGRKSNPGSHRIYLASGAKYIKCTDPTMPKDAEGATLVELRQDGHQTVLPGSVHVSGEPIRWEHNGQPKEIEARDLERYVYQIGAAALLVRHYPPSGCRHDFSLHLAGALIRAGWDQAGAENFIGAVARAARDEEAGSREGDVQTTVAKIEAGEAVTGFRSLAKMLDPRVAAAVARWLGLRAEVEPEDAHATDLGNSIRFVADHGDVVRYCHERERWYVWSGKHWSMDRTGMVARLARETVRKLLNESMKISDDYERRKKALNFALKSESARALSAMVSLAEADELVAVTAQDFDRDPYLLNVENGTLDLRTFDLREHDPADLLTHLIPYPYTPAAVAPRWERFLLELFREDLDLVTWVQRACGWCLTGDTSEHALFLLWGLGRNGKSTLVEVLRQIFGDLAVTIRFDALMASKGNTNTPDVAKLKGARLATAVESDAGHRLNEALIKTLTGGDRIAACRKYENPIEFEPTHKLFLATNHKPTIRGGDLAIWSRVKLVPFLETFQGDRRDAHLRDKLVAEAEGILAWLVEGCRMWRHHGLGTCRAVDEHTAAYRDEQDSVAQFLQDECEIGPDQRVTKADLYGRFKRWLEEQGERPVSAKTFGARLLERGLPISERKAGSVRSWIGVGLVS